MAATILQIIPRLDTGGAELATVEIARAVVAAGGRALVLTEGGRLIDDVLRGGGEVIRFPAASKNPLRMLANVGALARFIRAEQVDLVHARSRAPAWTSYLAARRTGRAFVTTYHGAYGSRGRLKTFYNSVMARGDLVIANSRYTAELIRARHGTPEPRLRVIPRGVDLERFDPDRVEPARIAALRQAWGVQPEQRLVLHAARLTAWKGQALVIDAAARLQADDLLGDTVIVFAGDAQGRTAYVADLERRIAGAGLQGKVRLVGHCDDMPAAFAAAYVTLVPSTQPEAFGRASAEAQAMGSPVIASDLGASPETVLAACEGTEGGTGWLVPAGDARRLAEAIAGALSMPPSERAAMGRRCRARILATFSLEAMRRATLAVYDELLGTDLARRLPSPRRDA